VFGAKGLKAVSILGTGSIKVHDPKALLASRIWLKNNYSFNLADLINQYGLNAAEMFSGEIYLKSLHAEGVLGAGMAIDCPLDFDQYGNLAYAEQLVKAISYCNDGNERPHAFGDLLA
jgi:hypothetical protein